jgi:thiosulfate dehydrogenase [quinone] large subunit
MYTILYKRTEHILFIIRLTLGWLMLYAGWAKIFNDSWTAAPFLLSAKSFSEIYAALAAPAVLPAVQFTNQWGLFFLGLSLITGIWVRLSAPLGAMLMILYYLPGLSFPYVSHGLLIDEHIIYALLLIAFWAQSKPFRFKEPVEWVKELALFVKTRKLTSL